MASKTVILHDIKYSVGGPKTVLNGIVNSVLNKKYNFVRLEQTEGCGFNPIKAIKFVRRYKKLINQQNADTIYICGLQYTGFLMTLAAKLSNIKKVVVSVHGSDWDNPDGTIRKWILMHIIEPMTVRLADSVFTVCGSAQRTIGALKYAKEGHNDGVVYNTFPNIDFESFKRGSLRKELKIDDSKIVVSVVGRVVEAKGHKYIIQAIKKFRNPDYVFVIVGDGPYLAKYRQECADEILNGRIKLLGVRSDVYQILCDSDIFLFATLNENHSLALLEAVNMGCCALVTDVGGNPEIIEHEKSGLLIPSRDSDSIISGLIRLRDAGLRRSFSQAAYETCKEKFSVQNTYGKLSKILDTEL